MAKLPTEKENNYCMMIVQGASGVESYTACYNSENMTYASIRAKVSELNRSPRVIAKIEALKREVAQMHNITVDKLLAELEEARNIALTAAKPQSAAAVAATMGKAKLAGLDKQIIEHQVQQPTSYTINLIAAVKHDAD
jgi:phage terminase small subunit